MGNNKNKNKNKGGAFGKTQDGAQGSGSSTAGSGSSTAQQPQAPTAGPLDVKALENTVVAGNAKLPQGHTYPFALRPAFGSQGMETKLIANYVPLSFPSDFKLYRYSISVSPEAKGLKLAYIVRLALDGDYLSKHKSRLATDYASNIVTYQDLTPQTLKDQAITDIPVIIVLHHPEHRVHDPTKDKVYEVKIQPIGDPLPLTALVKYLSEPFGTNGTDGKKLEIIQALNIWLHHYSKNAPNQVVVKDVVFYVGPGTTEWPTQQLRDFELRRGIYSSVRPATGRLLINLQGKVGLFFPHMSLALWMSKYLSNQAPGQAAINSLHSLIKGLRIKTTHLKGARGPKRLSGLARPGDGKSQARPDDKQSPDDKEAEDEEPPIVKGLGGPKDVQFWRIPRGASDDQVQKEVPGYITVFDYFKKTYPEIKLDPKLPVVNFGTKSRPSYYPAEVCVIEPGQPTRIKDTDLKDMSRFTIRPPQDTLSTVRQGPKLLGFGGEKSSNVFDGSGFEPPSDLITVTGRYLQPPAVKYKTGTAPCRNGGWNVAQQSFMNGPKTACLQKWGYIFVGAAPAAQDSAEVIQTCKEAVQELRQMLSSEGIQLLAEPQDCGLLWLQYPFEVQLKETMQGFAKRGCQHLLVILRNNAADIYRAIKCIGDVEVGLHTTCMLYDNVKKKRGRDQYLANVSLKINLKLGGVNHVLDRRTGSSPDFIEDGTTMIVGWDVTHPTAIDSGENAPSIAAMVASIDNNLAQWPAILAVQTEGRTEMVDDLENMLISRLKVWQKHNGNKLPSNILVYRDGVSEGEYSRVKADELPKLEAACRRMYAAAQQPPKSQPSGGSGPKPMTTPLQMKLPQNKGKKKEEVLTRPRITIVIGTKRHHTRFYPAPGSEDDKKGNPNAGLVVDRGVTEAHNWDFFAQPHAPIKGTAIPVRYFVVHDEIFGHYYPTLADRADKLEEVTNALSYVFGRATRSVSLCTPAKLADIVCERGRCYLFKSFGAGTEPGDTQAERAKRVTIHEKLRDSMFYI